MSSQGASPKPVLADSLELLPGSGGEDLEFTFPFTPLGQWPLWVTLFGTWGGCMQTGSLKLSSLCSENMERHTQEPSTLELCT